MAALRGAQYLDEVDKADGYPGDSIDKGIQASSAFVLDDWIVGDPLGLLASPSSGVIDFEGGTAAESLGNFRGVQ